MESIHEVEQIFSENSEGFTIYVCEQRFAVGRGHEYFKQYKGTNNVISNDSALKKAIRKMLAWTEKNVPNVADLVKQCFFSGCVANPISIIDIITSLSKLFSVNEHQAVGPEVIDPIILQEGAISSKYLAQLVALHKESILRPAIIILLKDNDFDRAKALLSKCPNGINVKMVRNSGKCEIYKVVNCGADDIYDFMDSFSLQCFSTCSKTSRNVLLNDEWADNSIVRYYSPLVFKIRSALLFDEKYQIRKDIQVLTNKLANESVSDDATHKLLLSFQCMAKLFTVYCYDHGGDELSDAISIASTLGVPLLVAHTYRYANLFANYSLQTKEQLLLQARSIFSEHNVEDHAIYCENNLLINQFYTDHIDVLRFREMQQEAVNNVPGLVGMSLILNNTGVAHIYSGRPDEAIDYFRKGLDYSRDRVAQKLGLMTNIIIVKSYCMEKIDEKEFKSVLNYIFDTLGTEKLPFLAANYIANIISVALQQDAKLAKQFVHDYPIFQVLQSALSPNQLGSGSLAMMLDLLGRRYPQFGSLGFDTLNIPKQRSPISGQREKFIKNHFLNPVIFNAWL